MIDIPTSTQKESVNPSISNISKQQRMKERPENLCFSHVIFFMFGFRPNTK